MPRGLNIFVLIASSNVPNFVHVSKCAQFVNIMQISAIAIQLLCALDSNSSVAMVIVLIHSVFCSRYSLCSLVCWHSLITFTRLMVLCIHFTKPGYTHSREILALVKTGISLITRCLVRLVIFNQLFFLQE